MTFDRAGQHVFKAYFDEKKIKEFTASRKEGKSSRKHTFNKRKTWKSSCLEQREVKVVDKRACRGKFESLCIIDRGLF